MGKENKDNCGFDVKLTKNTASMNRVGAKTYRDKVVISKIEDNDPETTFTSENETNVAKTVDDVAKDFAGPSYSAEKQGPEQIERFLEGKRHSYEHPAMVDKDQTLKDALKMQTDKPADKNKEVY
jgi:hypothetical protein